MAFVPRGAGEFPLPAARIDQGPPGETLLDSIRIDLTVDAMSHGTVLREQPHLRQPGPLAPSFQPNLLLRRMVTDRIESTAMFFLHMTEVHADILSETIVPGGLCAAP